MNSDKKDTLITQDTKIAQQILGQVLGNAKSGNGITINITTIGQISIGVDKSDQREVKLIKGNDKPDTKMFGPKSQSEKLLTDGRIKNFANRQSKEELIRVLNDNAWNRPKTAKVLGIEIGTLYGRIKRQGISPPSGSWPFPVRE